MNQTKVYTAPSADVVLMAPAETIAVDDWGFQWKNNGWFQFKSDTETPYSGVAINGTFADDGYTIIRDSNTQ